MSLRRKRGDPEYHTKNNLHPVWYLVDDDGNYVLDENGKKEIQYHIPEELACLTMYEKLLIRRCANFVPSVHLRNGIFGINGHCVTFPQDITEMCDELPQRKHGNFGHTGGVRFIRPLNCMILYI